jgi:hypothetical protein
MEPLLATNLIARLQTSGMTEEERNLKSFTRRTLMKLSNWADWDEAFDAQLDAHALTGVLGLPVLRPIAVGDEPLNILRIQ